ncbi:MAG: DUF3368 domain-containing protein [Candidatus Poribacteria bacterium]|nr:DUF3368 domain-containing protein [Candidatus Poribacteria bacterium]
MPVKPVVSNNSPLVALWRLDLLSLLRDLYTEVWIPRAVEKEFFGIEKKLRQEALNQASWIQTVDLTDPESVSDYDKLDVGEAAALALAKEHEARFVIIDEKKARQQASKIGLRVKGTVGVLIEAKKSGLISSIKPLLIELQKNRVYLTESIINAALKEVGEK